MRKLAAENGLHEVTDLSQIINNLIKVRPEDDEYAYAKRLVAACYVPTKGNGKDQWVKEAEKLIYENYKIEFTQGRHNISDKAKRQSCVFDIARGMFNDRFGARVRRSLMTHFGHHLALRLTSPRKDAEQLSFRGVTYYLYPATSTPSKGTKTREGPSVQSLIQQQYDSGKSIRVIKEEALSAISMLERNADLGTTEEDKEEALSAISMLERNADLGTTEEDGYCSNEFLLRDDDNSDERSDEDDSDDSSDDESSEDEGMFGGQGQDGYDLVNALTWCGEPHKSPKDVNPNEMNGNVYVCSKYRVWPSYAMYSAVAQKDKTQATSMMDDYLPEWNINDGRRNRLKNIYFQKMLWRYQGYPESDRVITDNKKTIESELKAISEEIVIKQQGKHFENQKVSMFSIHKSKVQMPISFL